MERLVVLQTQNDDKIREYEQILGRYGVQVVQDLSYRSGVGEEIPQEETQRIQSLLQTSTPERRVLAVMREQSDLFGPDGLPLTTYPDLTTPINKTQLEVFTLEKLGTDALSEPQQQLQKRLYEAKIPGYIDLDRRSPKRSVFGWDDLFVTQGTQLTYEEMRQRRLKRSGRDQVLTQ